MKRAAPDSLLCSGSNKYMYKIITASCHEIPFPAPTSESKTHSPPQNTGACTTPLECIQALLLQHQPPGFSSYQYSVPPRAYPIPTGHWRNLRLCDKLKKNLEFKNILSHSDETFKSYHLLQLSQSATTQTPTLPRPPWLKITSTTIARGKTTITYTGLAGAGYAAYTGYCNAHQEWKVTYQFRASLSYGKDNIVYLRDNMFI